MKRQLVMTGEESDYAQYSEIRTKILELVEMGLYADALEAIGGLSERQKLHGRMIIAEADCKYEIGDDLSALRGYVKYLKTFPRGGGRNFALMGISMCLKNLDLHEDAKYFLDQIDDNHEGKEKEVLHSIQTLNNQALGKLILKEAYLALKCDPVDGRSALD